MTTTTTKLALAATAVAVAVLAHAGPGRAQEDGPPRIRRGPLLTLGEGGDLVVKVIFDRKLDDAFVRVLSPDPAVSAAPTFELKAVQEDGLARTARLKDIRDGAVHRYCVGAKGLEPAWFELRAPPAADAKSVELAVFGDSGQGTKEQDQVAKLMLDAAPQFLLHTGDLLYPFGADQYLDKNFFQPYAKLLPRIPFFPCLGNHDTVADGGKAELAVLAYPPNENRDRFYSFDWGPLHVAVLDSNPLNYAKEGDPALPSTPQGKWLENDLAAARAPVKAVVMHHPLYSCFAKRKADYALMRATLEPILVRHGVELVLAGHDHFYHRTGRVLGGKADEKGIVHVLTGGGGAKLYDFEAGIETTAKVLKRYHFVHLKVTATQIDGRVISPDKDGAAEVIDEFKVTPRSVK